MMHHHPAVRHLILATLWQNPGARFIHIEWQINCLKFVKSIAAGKTSQAITVLLLRLVSLDNFLECLWALWTRRVLVNFGGRGSSCLFGTEQFL